MAALTHFSKTDNTVRTTTSTSTIELTDYTIPLANLTGAGFTVGDNVAIMVAVKTWNSSANNNNVFSAGHGTTFAGRATYDPGAHQRQEPVGTNAGDQFLWVGTSTLVTDENIYFSALTTAGTASFQEFVCLVLKLADLPADAWFYESLSHTTAPAAYDTSGAGATIPATGDWLLIGAGRFDIADTATDMLVAIHDGTGDLAEVRTQAEDITDFRLVTTTAAKALSLGATVRTRYRVATATTHTASHTWIFGLRLDAFQDHWIAHTTNTVTHSSVDAYQEFAGNGAYSKGVTGPFVVMGWPIHGYNATTERPYGRIQIGGSDWPAANANRQAVADNGAASKIAPFLYGYAASQGSGTLDIDLDCAEDAVATSYSCTEQVAVAFSLELAGAPPPPAGMVHPPAGRRFQHMIVR